MNTEPVLRDAAKQLLITAISALAAKYMPGLNLSDAQVASFALSVLTAATLVWSFLTRSKVTPNTKIEAVLKNDHPAAFAAMQRKP